jgi:tetratricopeptide (TPR) repeat protein
MRGPARSSGQIRLRALFHTLVLLATIVVPSRVLAQQVEPRARALELFEQSAQRYREGRFDDAAALLRQARTLHSEPLLTYNLARALEGAGDIDGAVAAYREYLAEAPRAADAPTVRARVEGLERHLEEVRALEAERAALRARASDTRPQRSADATPWVVTGTGAFVLAVGGAFGGVALARHADAQRAPTHRVASDARDEAVTFATAANALFIVGGAALVIGVVWGTVDVVSLENDRGTSAAIGIGPGSVVLHGAF